MQFFVPIPWPIALFIGVLWLVARGTILMFRVLINASAFIIGFARGYIRTARALRRARRPRPPVTNRSGEVIDGESRRVEDGD